MSNLPPIDTTPVRKRYGCHECREDMELVMGGRAHPSIREQYETHLQGCRTCRHMHRVMDALYEGPEVPAGPQGIYEEREFQQILERSRGEQEERPMRLLPKLAVPTGIAGLSLAALGLVFSLFQGDASDEGTARQIAAAHDLPAIADGRGDGSATAEDQDIETLQALADGGIDHPAQSYGRVVGGHGQLLTSAGTRVPTRTFPVGTRFKVGLNESLQVGLSGKIVGSFTPGAEVEWTDASPKLLEIEVHRGLVAFRYERKPSDPTLLVRTPTALVKVVGTVFTVQVNSDGETVVSVVRGEVEVLDPSSSRLLASVEAGYRFDVASSSYSDVSKAEIVAALPLSTEGPVEDELAQPSGRIPGSWNVPGLPTDPARRTIANMPDRGGNDLDAESFLELAEKPRREHILIEDEGEDLIEQLIRDAEATRRKELRAGLQQCRRLYQSEASRYKAGACLAKFMQKYGDDPAAVEGYLLIGILRMDFALDYRAAEDAFRHFLRRAPRHPSAELAVYRMWLAATEDGRISLAIKRGQIYLERYPNGKYVGKVLQRFPELKSAL